METAKEILQASLPIKCLEAVVVALYLTAPLANVHRLALSFKSKCSDMYYRYWLLEISDMLRRCIHDVGILYWLSTAVEILVHWVWAGEKTLCTNPSGTRLVHVNSVSSTMIVYLFKTSHLLIWFKLLSNLTKTVSTAVLYEQWRTPVDMLQPCSSYLQTTMMWWRYDWVLPYHVTYTAMSRLLGRYTSQHAHPNSLSSPSSLAPVSHSYHCPTPWKTHE